VGAGRSAHWTSALRCDSTSTMLYARLKGSTTISPAPSRRTNSRRRCGYGTPGPDGGVATPDANPIASGCNTREPTTTTITPAAFSLGCQKYQGVGLFHRSCIAKHSYSCAWLLRCDTPAQTQAPRVHHAGAHYHHHHLQQQHHRKRQQPATSSSQSTCFWGALTNRRPRWGIAATARQGLTLVHISAQLERCVWDKGCA